MQEAYFIGLISSWVKGLDLYNYSLKLHMYAD